MMTKIHVLPSETGKSVIKSTPRCDQGRLGMGVSCLQGGDRTFGDDAVGAALHEPSHIPGHIRPPEAVS